jgi:hypothetical protein
MTRFRLATLAVSLIAATVFALHFAETLHRLPDRSLLQELWRQARYFTILTTLLIAASFAAIAWRGQISSRWATGLTYWRAIVGIVYYALLARDLSGLRWWTDFGLHGLVPGCVFAWWLAIAPKHGLQPHDAVSWLIWPGIYTAYALIRGEADGLHPYFFIDPPLIGWPKVCMWICGMGLGFWLAGRAVIWACVQLMPSPDHPANDGPADPRPQ